MSTPKTQKKTSNLWKPTGGTFADRLSFLLDGRKPTPWARWLGMSSGTRDRLMKGEGVPPTYETLSRIMRTEHVSLSWLLGGSCAPYLVRRPIDDHETAASLRDLLEDSNAWRIELFVWRDLFVWILHQPAVIEHSQGETRYHELEVIAGPSGEATLSVIDAMRYGSVDSVHAGSEAFMRRAYAGGFGAYQLLGDERRPGYLDPSRPPAGVDLTRALGTSHRVKDGPLPTAESLVKWWPVLEEPERAAVTTLLDPFLANVAKRHKVRQH